MEFFSPTLLTPQELGPIALEGFWRRKLEKPLDQNFDRLAQHGWGHIELARATREPAERQYHFEEAAQVLDRDRLLEASDEAPNGGRLWAENWLATWTAANFLPVFQQLETPEGLQPETIEDLHIDLCDMLQRIGKLDLVHGVKRSLLARTAVLALGARHGEASRLLYPASYREGFALYAGGVTFTTYRLEDGLKSPFKVISHADRDKVQKNFIPPLLFNRLSALVLAGPGNSHKDFMTPLAHMLIAEVTGKASRQQTARINMVSEALDEKLKEFYLRTQEYTRASRLHLARSFGSLSLALNTPRRSSRLATEQKALLMRRRTGPDQAELTEVLAPDSPLPLAEALSADSLRTRLKMDRKFDRRYSLLQRGWDAIELAFIRKNRPEGEINWLATGIDFLADACRINNVQRDDDYFVAQVSLAAGSAWQRRARRQPLEARDIANVHNNFIFLLEQLLDDAEAPTKSEANYRGQLAELLALTLGTKCASDDSSSEYFLFPSSWRERRSYASLNHDSYRLWRGQKLPISIEYKFGDYKHRRRYPVRQIRIKEAIGEPLAAWLYPFSHDRDFLDLPADERADHAIELIARTLVQAHRNPHSLNALQNDLIHKATEIFKAQLNLVA